MKLREALIANEDQYLFSDGTQTWDADNLIEHLEKAEAGEDVQTLDQPVIEHNNALCVVTADGYAGKRLYTLIDRESLYINHGLGEQLVGTREQFRAALANIWPGWYDDYRNKLGDDEAPMTIDEYIEKSLDDSLSEADDEDIERAMAEGWMMSPFEISWSTDRIDAPNAMRVSDNAMSYYAVMPEYEVSVIEPAIADYCADSDYDGDTALEITYGDQVRRVITRGGYAYEDCHDAHRRWASLWRKQGSVAKK